MFPGERGPDGGRDTEQVNVRGSEIKRKEPNPRTSSRDWIVAPSASPFLHSNVLFWKICSAQHLKTPYKLIFFVVVFFFAPDLPRPVLRLWTLSSASELYPAFIRRCGNKQRKQHMASCRTRIPLRSLLSWTPIRVKSASVMARKRRDDVHDRSFNRPLS